MIKNRFCSALFKLILLTFGIIGIITNLLTTNNYISLLSYFTIQSNLFCVIIILYSIIKEILNKQYKTNLYFSVKMVFTMAILITCIVYNFILQPNSNYEFFTLSNLAVHLITPLLMFLDYMLFDIKGNFKIYFPFAFMIYPMIYCTYVFAYSKLGGRFADGGKYPYFFLDVNTLGFLGVLKWIGIIVLLVTIMGFLFYFFDKLLGKLFNKKNDTYTK